MLLNIWWRKYKTHFLLQHQRVSKLAHPPQPDSPPSVPPLHVGRSSSPDGGVQPLLRAVPPGGAEQGGGGEATAGLGARHEDHHARPQPGRQHETYTARVKMYFSK